MPRYISVGSTGVAVASGSGTTNRLMKFDASDDAADSSILDDGTNVTPDTNDGAALGLASTGEWSDLFLASGGVINWANGDVTLTHAANTLTLAGGVLAVPAGSEAAPSIVNAAATTSGISWITTSFLVSSNGGYEFQANTEGVAIASDTTYSLSSAANLGGTLDTKMGRAAAATPYFYGATTATGATVRLGNTNVGYEDFARNSEAHTLAAAGTSTTSTAVWPANSASQAASFRITTEITGCTSVQVGVAADTTRYGTFSTLTAGQTIAIGRIDNYAAQTGILFTAVGGGASFTAGVIRVNLRYVTASAPTS